MITAMMSESLLLSTLPLDVIRLIVRDKGVSLKSVALISRSWNLLARELRNTFPVLEYLSISFERGRLKIRLVVLSNDYAYLKGCLRMENICKMEYSWTVCSQMDKIKIYIPVTTGTKVEEQSWNDAVSGCIARAIFRFRRISVLQIDVATPRFLRIVDKALSAGVKLDKCTIITGHFGIALKTFTLDLFKRNTINELTIYAHYCDEKIGEFLLQLSKHTSILRIAQLQSPKNVLGIFGKPTSYWQTLAREMTENGMMNAWLGKIEIIDNPHAIHLNAIAHESSALAKIMWYLEL